MNAPTATEGGKGRSPPTRYRRLVWVAVAVLGVLVLLALLVDALRAPTALDPTTPEGAVQGYVQELLDGDLEGARAYLTDALQRRCSSTDLRQSWVADGTTVTLGDVQVDGEAATVDVQIRSLATPDLLGGGRADTETFELVREDGEWQVTGQPWPIYECRGVVSP